ncbi:serine/threonine protein kinase [Flavobacteriales bacterium 33_180_T64]|nr:serine/threonine protein kinase [Flavobacteriales bacterium 33_180_T64]
MSFIQFLKSKTFFKQLGLAIIALIVILFLTKQWLSSTTNHGEFIKVPDLKGKTLGTVEIELNDNDLVMEIQDSANYNPKYPKFSVIEQYPKAGAQVKENRKIYLTLNPSGYRKVAVPNIVRRTFRQAQPTLETLGFQVGKVTYVNDIGEDEVISMTYKGETITAGKMLPLTSKIDIVLGNGKRGSN